MISSDKLRVVIFVGSGFVVGVATGAVVGSLIVDKLENKKMSVDTKDDWIDDPNGVVQKAIERAHAKVDGVSAVVPLQKGKAKRNGPIQYHDIYKKEKEKQNLEELASKYKEESTESEKNEEEESKPAEVAKIRVISVEAYAEDKICNKMTLTYYEADDTLADSGEEIVADPVKLIGEDGLLNFGTLSDDPDIVYIMNEELGNIFEVIRVRKSYQEEVMGIKPEKSKKGKKGRKVEENDEEE